MLRKNLGLCPLIVTLNLLLTLNTGFEKEIPNPYPLIVALRLIWNSPEQGFEQEDPDPNPIHGVELIISGRLHPDYEPKTDCRSWLYTNPGCWTLSRPLSGRYLDLTGHCGAGNTQALKPLDRDSDPSFQPPLSQGFEREIPGS